MFGKIILEKFHIVPLYLEYLYRRVATTHDLNAILFPPSSENTVRYCPFVGSELPRGLGAYVSPYLYSAINVQCSYEKTK